MNHLAFLFTLGCLLLASCNKKQSTSSEVIRDCTGTYLVVDGQHNPVCNVQMLENIQTGTIVQAEYKLVGNGKCEDRESFHCAMVHPGVIGEWIRVIHIK